MQIRCPVCDHSREADLAKIPATAEFATCPKCRHRFRFRALDLDEMEHAEPLRPDPNHADVWDAVDSLQDRWRHKDEEEAQADGETDASEFRSSETKDAEIPWENPRALGYGPSLVRTTLWAFLAPSSFFAALSRRPALLPALLYSLAFGLAKHVLSGVWALLSMSMIRETMAESFGEEVAKHLETSMQATLAPDMLLIIPFVLAVQLFIIVAVVHVLIRVASPQTANFALTFKVASYASAGYLLAPVPIAGILLAPAWYFALLLIGCRSAFKLSWPKAVACMTPLYFLLYLVLSAQFTVVMTQ